ncbi:MAG: DUF2971 domain-containing protein [Oscillospiraceae bacterium]|nr:DUF2971 domain-containing protein [Oscillospiraceae bacterium]
MSKYVETLTNMGRPESEIESYQKKTAERPSSFFRFRPINIGNLPCRLTEMEGQLFLQPHKKLNDVLDLTIFDKSITDFDDMGNELIEVLGDQYFDEATRKLTPTEISRVRVAENKMKTLKVILREKYGEDFVRIFDKEIAQAYDDSLKRGIKIWERIRTACFGVELINFPMWHFYASDYSGICLEYAEEDIPMLEPVIYTDDLPEHKNVIMSILKTGKIFAIKEFCEVCCLHKITQWKYEDEWRLLDAEIDERFGEVPEPPLDIQQKIEKYIEQKLDENPDFDVSDIAIEDMTALYSDENYNEKMNNRLLNIEDSKDTDTEIKGRLFYDPNGDNNVEYINDDSIKCKYTPIKPIRVYLGHKLDQRIIDNLEKPKDSKNLTKIRNDIIAAAKDNGIEILQMRPTKQGYSPFTLDEIALQDRLEELKEKKKQILDKSNKDEYDEHMLSLCNEALYISETDAQIFNYRGCVFARMKKLDCAKNDFEKAVEIDPNDYLYRGNLACTLCDIAADSGNNSLFVGAIEEARVSLKNFFSYSNGYITIARAYAHMGQIENSVKTLEDGLKICDREYFLNKLKNSEGIKNLLQNSLAFKNAFNAKFPNFSAIM